jgi:ferritin
MISENIQVALNQQAAMEADAMSRYLAMALWADSNGYQGAAKLLYHSSDEERDHTLKFLKYVVDANGQALVPEIKAPPREYNSLPEICQLILDMEMAVASAIHKIVDMALAEKDHATFNFLQFFVAEQATAETQARATLDAVKLIGTEGQGLYLLDQYLGNLVKEG